jgi:hypothetical protein
METLRSVIARRAGLAAALAITSGLVGCDGAGSGGEPGTAGSAVASGTASAGSVVAAAPPERWTEIASEVAPLLMSPTEKEPPPDIIHRGELVRVGASVTATAWEGDLEGVPSKREGMLFRARRSAEGSETLAFQGDLGGEVTVSSTGALCEALAKKGPFELTGCKTSAQRARVADGAIVSFVRCGAGACPIAIEREGKLGAIALTNLTGVFFVTGKKKSLLVGVTRFSEDGGKHTGGKVAVVALDGAEPVKVGEHAADEIDARDPARAVQRIVSVEVTRSEVRVKGSREEKAADGKVLSSQKVDDRYPLPALD